MTSFRSAKSLLNILLVLAGIAFANLSYATTYNYSSSSSTPVTQGYAQANLGCDAVYTFNVNSGAISQGQGASYTIGMTDQVNGTYYGSGFPVPCAGTYTITVTDLAVWCNSSQWQDTSLNISGGTWSSNGGNYAQINGGGSSGNCQGNGWYYAYTNGQNNKGSTGGNANNPGHVLTFTSTSSLAAGTSVSLYMYGNDTNGSQNIYYVLSGTKGSGQTGTITLQRTGN